MDKKVKEINRRILSKKRFISLLMKYRKLLKLPVNGLSSREEYKLKWMNKINLDEYKKGDKAYFINKFFKEAQIILENIWEIDKSWNDVFFDYLFFNKTNKLQGINITGCHLDAEYKEDGIKEWERTCQQEFNGNLNIRVGLNSKTSDILSFVKNNKKFIKEMQSFLRCELKIKKQQRIRISPMAKRDALIYKLSKLNIKSLGIISGLNKIATEKGLLPPKYKAEHIQKILLEKGYSEISDGAIRKIISKELYDEVQRVFAEHNHHACRRRKYSFLLRGYLYCICNARMTAGYFKKKTKKYYYCQNRKECNESYSPLEKLEKQVENIFKKIKFSDDFIDLILEKVKLGYKEAQKVNKQQIKILTNKKTSLELKRDRLEDKLLDGIIEDKDFTRLKKKLKNGLDDIEEQLSKIDYNKELKIDKIQELLNFIKNIHSAYIKAGENTKKQYLSLFFKKIIVNNKKVKKTILNPLFEEVIKSQKAFYKTQKSSLKEMITVPSTGSYSKQKFLIRNEWGHTISLIRNSLLNNDVYVSNLNL